MLYHFRKTAEIRSLLLLIFISVLMHLLGPYLSCPRERMFQLTLNAGLCTLYGPSVLYVPPVSFHFTLLDAFQVVVNLKALCPGHYLKFKAQRH
jgi:hypothetical protein